METELKVYEGNSIIGTKRLIELNIKQASKHEVIDIISSYIKYSYSLGYRERIVDFQLSKNSCDVWITYTHEKLSLILLNDIIAGYSREDIVNKLTLEKENILICKMIEYSHFIGLPLIRLCNNLYQFGYGKNSVVIGENYQSLENNDKAIVCKDEGVLEDILRYNNIPRVNKLDRNERKPEYKVICYKGNIGIILRFRNDHYEVYDKADEMFKGLESTFCNLVKKIYRAIKLNFMYIDIVYEGEIKFIKLGSIFEIYNLRENFYIKTAEYLINNLIRDGVGSIPIIAITGTNGKTSTARFIYSILNNLGYITGLSCTGGIFIGRDNINNGDTTGFLSAREILTNNKVEVAVLETARGGILKNGLGYEGADVALLTSISEDHIGMRGVNGIEDLLRVKSVIFNELKQGGKIIVKAQSEIMSAIIHRDNVCLFSEKANEYINDHIAKGREAIYVENNCIILNQQGKKMNLVHIKDIPFVHNGLSKSNILNVIASIIAVYNIHKDLSDIVEAAKKIECNIETNPGRQNIINMGNFKIMLDYGHNREAYTEVFNTIKLLKPAKITAIISAPGDRQDKYIRELGTISAKYSDYIIIREQADLRGRKQGESSSIIKQGTLEEGFSEDKIKIIYKEEDALIYAAENAAEDEMIVLFTQELGTIVPVVNSLLDRFGKERIGEGIDFRH